MGRPSFDKETHKKVMHRMYTKICVGEDEITENKIGIGEILALRFRYNICSAASYTKNYQLPSIWLDIQKDDREIEKTRELRVEYLTAIGANNTEIVKAQKSLDNCYFVPDINSNDMLLYYNKIDTKLIEENFIKAVLLRYDDFLSIDDLIIETLLIGLQNISKQNRSYYYLNKFRNSILDDKSRIDWLTGLHIKRYKAVIEELNSYESGNILIRIRNIIKAEPVCVNGMLIWSIKNIFSKHVGKIVRRTKQQHEDGPGRHYNF